MKKPRIAIRKVSPRMAEKWMANQASNRSISSDVVAKYASDMRARKWRINGSTICFDTDDRMINGQHRCLACIEANEPFYTILVFDLDKEEVFHSIDTGRARSAADFLGFKDFKNCASLAAIARVLNKILSAQPKDSKAYNSRSVDPLTSFRALEEFIEAHPVLVRVADLISSVRRSITGIIDGSILGGVVAAAAEIVDSDAAFEFLEKMATGEGLQKGDAIHTTRERLVRMAAARGIKMSVNEKLALIQRAWGYWITNTPLSKTGGTRSETPIVLYVVGPHQSIQSMYPK